MVCLDKSSQTIVKSPPEERLKDYIDVERKIYERFSEHSGHTGILRYCGPYELGIRLEFASNNNIRSFFVTHTKVTDIEQRLRWAKQIAEALRFVHSTNVIYGDLTCCNKLLDGCLNTKLADFGGSSLRQSAFCFARGRPKFSATAPQDSGFTAIAR